MNISNIVNTYCTTNRKIYQLSRGVDYGQSEAMILGSAVHSVIEKIYEKAKLRLLNPIDFQESLGGLKDDKYLTYLIWNGDKLQALFDLSSNEEEYESRLSEIIELMKEIVDFEIKRLEDQKLSREILILDLEKYVNGFPLSIGTGKIDVVFRYEESIGVGDLKTGKIWGDNHDSKIQITIYAMLLESELKRNVDWGAVIFPFDYVNGTRTLRREPLKVIFPITTELREEALERLDEIEKLLCDGAAPKLCYRCRTQTICQMGGT